MLNREIKNHDVSLNQYEQNNNKVYTKLKNVSKKDVHETLIENSTTYLYPWNP